MYSTARKPTTKASSYKSPGNSLEKIAELMNETEILEDSFNPKWKDIAQGMHTLSNFNDSISDEEVAEVYNEFQNRNYLPSQFVAEEAAFEYATQEELSIEEAIESAKEKYN
jgi:hypothetical protein